MRIPREIIRISIEHVWIPLERIRIFRWKCVDSLRKFAALAHVSTIWAQNGVFYHGLCRLLVTVSSDSSSQWPGGMREAIRRPLLQQGCRRVGSTCQVPVQFLSPSSPSSLPLPSSWPGSVFIPLQNPPRRPAHSAGPGQT